MASISFHLTASEKKDIVSSLKSSVNIEVFDKLLALYYGGK